MSTSYLTENVRKSALTARVETLSVDAGVSQTMAAVTEVANAVTVHAHTGKITTVPLVTAAGLTHQIVMTNNQIRITDIVQVTIQGYAGATGIPVVRVSSVGLGTATIVVTNAAAAAALDSDVVLGFVVTHAV